MAEARRLWKFDRYRIRRHYPPQLLAQGAEVHAATYSAALKKAKSLFAGDVDYPQEFRLIDDHIAGDTMTPAGRSRVEWIYKHLKLNAYRVTLEGYQQRKNPLTSISDAMEALEAWADAGDRSYELWRECHTRYQYVVTLYEYNNIVVDETPAETLPRAIVLALCEATNYKEADNA